jgi:branched-chain amino acid transport system substrate-binding protein
LPGASRIKYAAELRKQKRIKTLPTRNRNLAFALLATTLSMMLTGHAGAAETTIKLGNTAPYSGPASAYGTVARAEQAYFAMLNDQGGINGRKIEFLTLDDGYSPSKTVEQTRKLVEQDEVLALFSSVGTAPNISVQKYLNTKHVPQLFVSSGATRWNDPEQFPWTVGFNPTYELEGQIYAQYILQAKPNAKIAVITPNEDAGKDYLRGFKAGLGEHADQLVSQTTYLTSDPTIDSQMVTMRVGRGRFLRRGDASIRGASHQESRQHGLETADHPAVGLQLGVRGAGTGRDREHHRRGDGALSQRSQRCALGG